MKNRLFDCRQVDRWWRWFGLWALAVGMLAGAPVTFVFTSDVHYGINRGNFRGAANVESRIVNAAMVAQINALPGARLPADSGLRSGEVVGPIAFVIVTIATCRWNLALGWM